MKKAVAVTKEQDNAKNISEWKEFSDDLSPLFSVKELSKGLVQTIVKEAEKLLNQPNTMQRMPSISATDGPLKYLVAAKNCKRGMCECTMHRNHVTCTCPCYKYNGLCKHSLCVAQTRGILNGHIDHFIKSPRRLKPSKSALTVPEKPAAGKKGSCHNYAWRPSRGKRSSDGCPQPGAVHRPYSDVHHNDRPLIVCFLTEPKAKECRQCRTEFPRVPRLTLCCRMRKDGCTQTRTIQV